MLSHKHLNIMPSFLNMGEKRMGNKSLYTKAAVYIIIFLFIATSILPTISGDNIEQGEKTNIESQQHVKNQEDVAVTCYSLGLHEQSTKEIKIPYGEVAELFSKISDYSIEIASDSQSEETKQLLQDIISLAGEQDLLPADISTETLHSNFNPLLRLQKARVSPLSTLQNKASAFFCNFVTTGTGSQFPIIILPRLIPFLLLPIPRVFLRWSAYDGVTS